MAYLVAGESAFSTKSSFLTFFVTLTGNKVVEYCKSPPSMDWGLFILIAVSKYSLFLVVWARLIFFEYYQSKTIKIIAFSFKIKYSKLIVSKGGRSMVNSRKLGPRLISISRLMLTIRS